MSESEADRAGVDPDSYDTTTRIYRGHDVAEMSVIGWLVFLVALIVALPLIPFVVLAWLIERFAAGLSGSDGA